MRGYVKKLLADKGCGFIKGEDGTERFFHRSGVRGDFNQLVEGDRVQFDDEPSEKGPRATNVDPGHSAP